MIALAVGVLLGVNAEIEKGIVSSVDGFAYLGKFCFDYTAKSKNLNKPANDGSTMT